MTAKVPKEPPKDIRVQFQRAVRELLGKDYPDAYYDFVASHFYWFL